MSVHQEDKRVYETIKKLLDIPEDEPIFIIRAQDRFSVKLIQYYRKMVRDGSKVEVKKLFSWYENVGSVISDFINWQRDNRDKVKVPD
jgi:hypothetical protein